MPSLRRPRPLPPGGTIGIAAPAFPIDPEKLEAGEAMWRGLGFRTRRRDDVLAADGFLAGDDTRRAKELMALLLDPEVDAVVCARGGYGCHRIVSRLDASRVREAAKPVVGYSDVTTLLLWLRRRAGLVGFHGPMLEKGDGQSPEALDSLVGALTGRAAPAVLRGEPGGGGRRRGRLVGGNLVTLVSSLGTPWEVDTRGAILLLEEIGERPYRIDRMLQQLLAAGKLAGLAGLAVGQLVGCEDARYPTPTAEQVIDDVVRPLGLPFVRGLAFGHGAPNLTWAHGVRAEIDGDAGLVRPLEKGVATAR